MSNFGRSRGGPPQAQRMPPGALISGATVIGGAGPARHAGAAGAKGGAAPAGPSAVVQVTEREFEAEVMQSELPVMLEFAAEAAPQSKQVAPVVEEFAREMAGKLKVVRIDVERSPLLARELRIQSIPTFMVFAEGRIADGVVGLLDKKKMQALVEPFLPRAAGALKTAELAQLLPGGQVTPVDTRDAAAFARAHLPRAVHMPLEEVPTRVAELYMLPGQPVLYCRSGDKSKELAATLGEQGVEVAFLEGGLLGWESDGLPIQRGAS
jgi:thioredoxin 1/putative thioredoxin